RVRAAGPHPRGAAHRVRAAQDLRRDGDGGVQRQPGRDLPRAPAVGGGRPHRRDGAARWPRAARAGVPAHARGRRRAPGVAGAAGHARRRGAAARRPGAALRLPGLRRLPGPDARLPRAVRGGAGGLPLRAGAAARGDPVGSGARAPRPRGGDLLHRGPAPLGAGGPRATHVHRSSEMSETTTATTPAAPAVARTPASIAARTVLFALGLLAAMRIGDALAGVLVPSVGRALVEQAVGGGSAMGAADAVVSASATGPASAASTAGAA